MRFATAFITALFAITCVSALPDLTGIAREAENEIYKRDLAHLGLTRREDHPNHEAVRNEARWLAAARAERAIKRMPSLDCPSVNCDHDQDCKDVARGCVHCDGGGHCSEYGPPPPAPPLPPQPNPPSPDPLVIKGSKKSSKSSKQKGGKRSDN